jgi:RNA polymerase sigma factor (sigma-70 family)
LDLPPSSADGASASPVEALIARPDSAELVREYARTGRADLFEQIVKHHASMVYATAMRVVKDPHDAEDIAQATFLTLAAKGRVGGEILCPEAWLRRVAHRLALDFIRGNKRRVRRQVVRSEMDGLRHHPDSSQHAQNNETGRILREELDRLPPSYRVPLMLHYFGGLDRDAIAGQLKLNPSTLGVRLHRAREQLRKRMSDRGVMLPAAALGAVLARLLHDSIVNASTGASSGMAAVSLASGVRAWVTASVPTTIKLAVAGVALVASVGASVAAVVSDVPGLILRQIEKLVPAAPTRHLLTPVRPLISEVAPPDQTALLPPVDDAKASYVAVPLIASAPAIASSGPILPVPRSLPAPPAIRWQPAAAPVASADARSHPMFVVPTPAPVRTADAPATTLARFAPPPPADRPRVAAAPLKVRGDRAHSGVNLSALSLIEPPILPSGLTGDDPSSADLVAQLEASIDYAPNDDSHDLQTTLPAVTPRSLSVSERTSATATTPPIPTSVPATPRPVDPSGTAESSPSNPAVVPVAATQPDRFAFTSTSTTESGVVGQAVDASIAPTPAVNPKGTTRPRKPVPAVHNEVVEFAGIDRIRSGSFAVPTELDWSFGTVSLVKPTGPISTVFVTPGANAVRLELVGKRSSEPAAIRMVLAPDVTRVGVPALPTEHTFIGVWMVENPGDYEAATITVRYDELLASRLGRNESVLKLWVSDGKTWTLLLNDPSFGIDIDKNLIWARTSDARFFAVSAPEPALLGALVSASILVLRRRR